MNKKNHEPVEMLGISGDAGLNLQDKTDYLQISSTAHNIHYLTNTSYPVELSRS
jgi:hypothetical protein